MVHPTRRRRGEGRSTSRRKDGGRARQDIGRTVVPGAGDEDRHRRRRLYAFEADALRRAMATFRRSGTIHGFRDKFIQA